MTQSHSEPTSPHRLGFSDAPLDLHTARANLSKEAKIRCALFRERTHLVAQTTSVTQLLPVVRYEDTEWRVTMQKESRERRGKGSHFIDGLDELVGPKLTGELPTDPPIEHTYFTVLVLLANPTSMPMNGTLQASVNGVMMSGPFATYVVSNLLAFETLQVSLVVVAPRAGVAHTLRLELVDVGTSQVVTASDLQFPTAALYQVVIESAHVFEARSPRTDTLIFAGNAYGKYGLELGDHGDGDDIPINSVSDFARVPDDDNSSICQYFILNLGSIMSKKDATKTATYLSLIFDLLSGGINSTGVATSDPSAIPQTGVTLSVSYALWVTIIEAVLTLNCNGVVAYEDVRMPGWALDALTGTGNVLKETVMFEGSDSPEGCGGNSRYSVTRSIRRIS